MTATTRPRNTPYFTTWTIPSSVPRGLPSTFSNKLTIQDLSFFRIKATLIHWHLMALLPTSAFTHRLCWIISLVFLCIFWFSCMQFYIISQLTYLFPTYLCRIYLCMAFWLWLWLIILISSLLLLLGGRGEVELPGPTSVITAQLYTVLNWLIMANGERSPSHICFDQTRNNLNFFIKCSLASYSKYLNLINILGDMDSKMEVTP